MAQMVILKGTEIKNYSDELAKMRLEYFKGFPYLYEGNLENERRNFRKLTDNWRSILLIALEGQEIAAVSTATPLDSGYVDVPQDIFRNMGFINQDLYYFGEIIVHQKFQGKGLASQIFKEQEDYAGILGYQGVCFLAVERDHNHPLKPVGYQENDSIWEHLGYQKTNKVVFLEWPTALSNGKVENIKNKLVFWIKIIN